MQNTAANIIHFIKQSTGKDLSIFDNAFFRHTLKKKTGEAGLPTPKDYYNFLKEHPEETKSFASSFNVTYSEFFRDPLIFALLKQWILPSFFSGKENSENNEIRIWSAGAAAGQEAYSLAMLADHLKALYHSNITVRIFASDICHSEIEKAKNGTYPTDQLQNVSLGYLNQYFYPVGKGYKLIPRIRESVDFSIYDILDTKTISPPDSIYGSFDLIYCSNLFIYYNAQTRSRIVQKLKKNLTVGGLLVCDNSEKEILARHKLHAVYPPAAIFQKETIRK
jgi:chemotaxis methyl-accepting protein methylase